MSEPTAFRPSPRIVVASLWLFVTLNYIYCDILGLMWSEDLKGFLEGDIGGIKVTQGFLLGASVLMTIPMASVLISRIAPHRFARWASVAAGVIMTLVQLGSLTVGDGNTMHYIYFSIIEASTTAFIVWFALTRWKTDRA